MKIFSQIISECLNQLINDGDVCRERERERERGLLNSDGAQIQKISTGVQYVV